MPFDFNTFKKSKSFLPAIIIAVTAIIISAVLILTLSGDKAIIDGDFELAQNSDGTYTVVSYLGKADTAYIPGWYNGTPVTAIGATAFKGCANLQQVLIPGSITVIGGSAFEDCTSLDDVVIPSGVKIIETHAFSGCASLKSIVLPEGLVEIGKFAFYECGSLSKIKIPESVELVDSYAFSNCTSLMSLNIPDSVKNIKNSAFAGCSSLLEVVFGKSLLSIGSDAFSGCSSIIDVYYTGGEEEWQDVNVDAGNDPITDKEMKFELVTVGLEYTDVGDGTLAVIGMGTATDRFIKIPSEFAGMTVTVIDAGAFSGHREILGVLIPDTIVKIGSYAFKNCELIEELDIPESVVFIDESAFAGCSSLSSISLPISNGVSDTSYLFGYIFGNDANETMKQVNQSTSWGDFAFVLPKNLRTVILKGDNIPNYYLSGCDMIRSVIISESVKTISEGAFRNCTELKNLTIHEGVERIEQNAFASCTSLLNVDLPNSLTYIGRSAFECCESISEINIGKNVTAIEACAFYGCVSVEKIYFNAKKCEYIDDSSKFFEETNYANVVLTIGKAVTALPQSMFIGAAITDVVFDEECCIDRLEAGVFAYCSSLKRINLPQTITYIGEEAFYYCSSLESILIPYDVESIGSSTFYMCENLSNVGFGEDLKEIDEYAFSGTALTSIVVPDSVETIGRSAFSHCEKATYIYIGKGVIEIGLDAFENASALETMHFNAVAANSPQGDWFQGCATEKGAELVIGEDVTVIAEGMFHASNGNNLTKLSFEEGAVCHSIGSYAFSRSSALKEINLPESLTSLASEAFAYTENVEKINFLCKNLTNVGGPLLSFYDYYEDKSVSVFIGKDVEIIPGPIFSNLLHMRELVFEDGSVCKSIGSSAFKSVIGLTSIRLPDTIKSIGDYAFSGCENATEIYMGNSIETIGEYAFSGCTSYTELLLPETLRYISFGAFSDNHNVKTIKYNARDLSFSTSRIYFGEVAGDVRVIVGNKVERIPEGLFRLCPSIRTLEFEEGSICREICSSAFNACENLEEVTLPESLEILGEYAFKGSTNLREVYLLSENLDCESYSCFGNSGETDGFKVYIGSRVKKIPDQIFGDSSNANSNMGVSEIIFAEDGVLEEIGYGAFNYSELLREVTIPDTVITIGSHAFSSCIRLRSLYIHDGVETIGEYAFDNCERLESIRVPNTLRDIDTQAFGGTLPTCATRYGSGSYLGNEENPYALLFRVEEDADESFTIHPETKYVHSYVLARTDKVKNLLLGDNIKVLTEDAFSEALSLVSVSLGQGIKNIPTRCFSNCRSLESVSFFGFVNTIESSAFYGCSILDNVVLPHSVRVIEDYAFEDCTLLKNVFMSYAIEVVGNDAFPLGCATKYENGYYLGTDNNPYIVLIYLDSSVNAVINPDTKVIAESSLGNCHSQEITIPDSVEYVNEIAFYYNPTVKKINIGAGVKVIGDNAFYYCSALENINVSEYNQTYSSINGNLYSKDKKALITYCPAKENKLFIIPNGVETIKTSAFYKCQNLNEIEIPNSVTKIESGAITDCDYINKLKIPDSVVECEGSIAVICEYMTAIELGSGITELNYSLFAYCKYVSKIYITESVKLINFSNFNELYNKVTIYYTGTEEDWKNIQIKASYYSNYDVVFEYGS